MVKKKGKSKRVTLKDKYKIQRRVVETGRKRKKHPGRCQEWHFQARQDQEGSGDSKLVAL